MTINSDLLIVRTLRMSGAIPLLPVHTFQLHHLPVPLYKSRSTYGLHQSDSVTRYLLAQSWHGRCDVRGFHCLDFEDSTANLTYPAVSNALFRSVRIS